MKAENERLASTAKHYHGVFNLTATNALRCAYLLLILVVFSALVSPPRAVAQDDAPMDGNFRLWGDVNLSESDDTVNSPLSLTVILYNVNEHRQVGRQTVNTRNGRYRFNNLRVGEYEVAVEADNGDEVARVRISLSGPANSDFRQNFEFEGKPTPAGAKPKAGTISAADVYNRPAANKSVFQKAQESVEKKKYDQAVTLLMQIVSSDKLDFQAWTLLGMVYAIQEKWTDAEKAYLSAIEARPASSLALLNLGRLQASQKKFNEAIEPLTRAVEAQPQSADANLLLGEAYLQVKKGSKAVGYLNEAARLGRAEAHLRLAWLYNAAGMKDKAAVEYEEFLKKRPDYPDRKKLQEYIGTNKKG